ncbi:retrovirus-related Pol polyprotein from transposon opus [Trichonephila clavata]|uniref:Retrovirus-related Pol polyprotein from transposon opus n=1 Tax=Trichonephila clavata TaxID=2740835 RepID=A0A8X6M634_TRICU|nr:retrovirus-related Pol polyprotein from transposon opus [Trichonephila clavata]
MVSEKYVPPHQRKENATARRNIPRQRDCYICGSQQHLARRCPKERMKNGFTQSSRNSIANSSANDTTNREAAVATVESSYLQLEPNQNIVNPLKRIPIFIDSREIDAIIVSGSQIAVIHSSLVPRLKDKEGNTLVAVTDQLNVPCLVTPEIHELLTKPADGGIGGSGGAHEERKVLAVHFETNERTGEKTPPGRHVPERLREKTNEPRGGNGAASNLNLEAEGEYLKDPKGGNNNEDVMHSSSSVKLLIEQKC